MHPFRRQILFYLIIALLFFVAMKLMLDAGSAPDKIAYNEFVEQVKNNRVEKVVAFGNEIEAELKDGSTVITRRPDDHNLTDLLLENNIPYETNAPRGPSWWQTAIHPTRFCTTCR
ncbi:MAG TPA: ATP-dependent metallopeptidase FtsH/Yme1/Tma family protein, partial [Bacillota bacterium]|nr:ATP-dependent metallopeptidase FtsH/Yme1/Tma family protein [Bacillota bacterium]